MKKVIREPLQKRAIETRDKILDAGFELFCTDGYHNTDTSKIAKKANVSTGIVYQYFKDKHDILMASLEKNQDLLFFNINNYKNIKITKKTFPKTLEQTIQNYINNSKLSHEAYMEIKAMAYTDKDVAKLFNSHQEKSIKAIKKLFEKSDFNQENLDEKINLIIIIIWNVIIESLYYKRKPLNRTVFQKIAIDEIMHILKD